MPARIAIQNSPEYMDNPIPIPINHGQTECDYTPDDQLPCAWCHPHSTGNSYGSHGICPKHKAEQIAKLKESVK